MKSQLSWKVGGQQGEGIESTGEIFATAIAAPAATLTLVIASAAMSAAATALGAILTVVIASSSIASVSILCNAILFLLYDQAKLVPCILVTFPVYVATAPAAT